MQHRSEKRQPETYDAQGGVREIIESYPYALSEDERYKLSVLVESTKWARDFRGWCVGRY